MDCYCIRTDLNESDKMYSEQPLDIIWDDVSSIDSSLLTILTKMGLAPRPINIHSLSSSIAEITGPVILSICADSFASVDAMMTLVKSFPFKIFTVLRVHPHQFELGLDAVKKGIDEVICEGQDTEKKWDKIAAQARVGLLKGDSYVFVDELSQHLLALIERVGASEVTALMNGPTGSGKEVLARLTHDFSPRRSGPFVPVNCAALPESLAESLLFGHSKGAFTGATKTTVGFFEQAEGGTLFLDEVGELPLQIQAKLLRALQEKEITLIGSAESRPVNARIITATNRDLRHAIRVGQFREDLYFRISTFRINVPGLRERSDDILPLSNFFLVKYGNGEQVPNISPDALTKLLGYEWPGNVRELENVIQRAVVLSDGKDITADHLFFDDPVYDVPATGQEVRAGFTGPAYDVPSETRSPSSDSFYGAVESEQSSYGAVEGDQSRSGLQSAMDANEFRVIAETLRNSRTRKEAAARLGISERTLRYKVSRMKDRGIDIPRRKWA